VLEAQFVFSVAVDARSGKRDSVGGSGVDEFLFFSSHWHHHVLRRLWDFHFVIDAQVVVGEFGMLKLSKYGRRFSRDDVLSSPTLCSFIRVVWSLFCCHLTQVR
jgi:hypothetical protein